MKKVSSTILVFLLLLTGSHLSGAVKAAENFDGTDSVIEQPVVEQERKSVFFPIFKKKKQEEVKTELAPLVENTQTAETEAVTEKPKNKKFFSILERNKDSDETKAEKAEKKKNTVTVESSEDYTKEQLAIDDEPGTTNINVDSDIIEYFPERHEFEAIGNAKVTFTEEGSVLTADKIIFNHETNFIRAYDNVTLTRAGQKLNGDYMQVNLNDENAMITNPVLKHMNIKISAKVANVNEVKTEAMEGVANFTDKTMYRFISRSIFGLENPLIDDEEDKNYFIKEKFNNEWRIKTKVIVVDSYKDHDVVTMKGADIFLKDLKVGRSNELKIYTDKEQSFVETNIVEFGSMKNLGMYLSPGYVFQLPKGSTLKMGPAVGYASEFGFGAMAKFQNAYNRTDFGYMSNKDKIVVRGKHQFNERWSSQYGINSYLNEWFMGGRMPKYGMQVMHTTPYYDENLKLRFENRLSGGLYKDWDSNFSTIRLRWQTQTMKEIYEYKNSDAKFATSFGLGVQSTVSLYGTGDTYALARIGPHIRTQYKNWNQYVAYYIGGEAGETPFWFDQFFYGKSSVQVGESLRINKYLTIMYAATLALSSTPNDKMFQENRFYAVVGPDDFKVMIGYDAFRQTTTLGFNIALGTENSNVEFERLIINDPTNIGKSSDQKDSKKATKAPLQHVNQKVPKKVEDPMDMSVKEYGDYSPVPGMLNNMLMPYGSKPPGY